MPPLTRRRAGAGEASIALRRDAYVGVGRRGSAGVLRARAAFDVRIHMYLHTTQKTSRGERHRAADAVAGGRGADGVRPGPPRGRPASPPTTAGPHRRGGRLLPSGLPTVTQSSGPSLPHTYTVRTAR